MKLLFVADPLETFKTIQGFHLRHDAQAAKRGMRSWLASRRSWCGSAVGDNDAHGVRAYRADGRCDRWFVTEQVADLALADAGAVLMRGPAL